MAATVAGTPAHTMRTRVQLHDDYVANGPSTAYPGAYAGIDDSWRIEQFKQDFRIEVISMSDEAIEFDMIGIDAALANTLRRILIAEVPTLAIESVYITQNTSIMTDESLAHRLGLIPIKVDPRRFSFKTAEATDENTVVFRLHTKCTTNTSAPPSATLPDEKFTNSKVLSGQLDWVPQGSQEEMFGPGGIHPVHDDILICKLRPGQEITAELHCVKGTGKTHAKWSPVCTASYRLMPEIVLKQDVVGDQARRLQACFSKGVIALDEVPGGGVKARVANPRLDTVSREVMRHPDLAALVELNRIRDHFIFSIESTGVLPAADLLVEAIRVLREKCTTVTNDLVFLTTGERPEGEDEDYEAIEGEEVEHVQADDATAMDEGDD
eukprot:m.77904 g.77904  ORF g.77904 m.77904 type:complete len:382 (-) comp14565_c0_seq2:49-1194(-)